MKDLLGINMYHAMQTPLYIRNVMMGVFMWTAWMAMGGEVNAQILPPTFWGTLPPSAQEAPAVMQAEQEVNQALYYFLQCGDYLFFRQGVVPTVVPSLSNYGSPHRGAPDSLSTPSDPTGISEGTRNLPLPPAIDPDSVLDVMFAESHLHDLSVGVSPNPSPDVFRISVANHQGEYAIQVLDQAGTPLTRVEGHCIEEVDHLLDLSAYPEGIYRAFIQLGEVEVPFILVREDLVEQELEGK